MALLHYEHLSDVHCLGHIATTKNSKNLPKTFPKRRPNPLKIDAETCVFSNIAFLRFWLRFWSLLGLQVGAKLAALASQDYPKASKVQLFGSKCPRGSKVAPRSSKGCQKCSQEAPIWSKSGKNDPELANMGPISKLGAFL